MTQVMFKIDLNQEDNDSNSDSLDMKNFVWPKGRDQSGERSPRRFTQMLIRLGSFES